MQKAHAIALTTALSAGYGEADSTNLYVGGPVYVQDLVKLNPFVYGQLYAHLFKLEEIKLSTRLAALPRSQWWAILENGSLRQTVAWAVNDIAARYSGYYEVPIFHVKDGCVLEVRFMAAQLSNWSAGQLCGGKPMLTALEVQQLTGLTAEPKLVTFEHTDTPWGMMWLVGSVAVQPYNAELYVVTLRDGTIIDPLISPVNLEIQESYDIGKYGPVLQRRYLLPVQLRSLAFVN